MDDGDDARVATTPPRWHQTDSIILPSSIRPTDPELQFIRQQMDPESEGPLLPTQEQEEYRPFQRRLPEFKFWYQCSKVRTVH